MKIDTIGNRAALEQEADINAACRARIRDYLARTGLAIPEFARRIGYGNSTIRLFLSDSYHNVSRSAKTLVTAANQFMDRCPVGQPNEVMGELYETSNVRTIRETFEKLLPRPVAHMIYAPPGSQKTFVLEHEVARLTREELLNDTGRRAFYVYCRQGIRPRDLVRRICIACGCRVGNDIEPMLQGIRFDLRNLRVVLVLDEAQHLSIDCLETVRELLDQPPYCSLLLAGSHDLKKRFDEFSATLEQWNSRIVAKDRLPGLERTEAIAIIQREVGHLLRELQPHQAQAKIDKLIQASMAKDAFAGDCPYINVRTLTNALDRIKAEAEARAIEAAEKVEVMA